MVTITRRNYPRPPLTSGIPESAAKPAKAAKKKAVKVAKKKKARAK